MVYHAGKLLFYSPRQHSVPVHLPIGAFIGVEMTTGVIQGLALGCSFPWASLGVSTIVPASASGLHRSAHFWLD